MRAERRPDQTGVAPALPRRRGERVGVFVCTCVWMTAFCGANAAQPFRETFATNLSGWASAAGPVWIPTNATAGVNFGAQGFFFPETATLVASNGASGGAFVGNHAVAGLQAIGFDLLALDVPPLSVTLDLYSGTNLFFRALPLTGLATGVWRTFAVNAETKAGGGWSGGTEASFAAARTNVTHVRIRVDRASAVAQRFRVDNVFLSVPPRAVEIMPEADAIKVTWTNLIAGLHYRCEAAGDLASGAWSTVTNFSAAGDAILITMPATNAVPAALRLTGE